MRPTSLPVLDGQDAEHIRLADQFVEVPGGRSANNYGNVRLIVQVAQRAGVDAVWPGWWAPRAALKFAIGNVWFATSPVPIK